MAEQNQKAEAVLFVIKRLFKWLVIGIAGLVALGAMIGGGFWAHHYITVEFPKSNVEVTATIGAEQCKKESWPIQVKILNNSSKTIRSTGFSFTATKPGFSKTYTKYHYYTSDKIILPNQGWFSCWAAPIEAKDSKPEEFEWKIKSYFVKFMD